MSSKTRTVETRGGTYVIRTYSRTDRTLLRTPNKGYMRLPIDGKEVPIIAVEPWLPKVGEPLNMLLEDYGVCTTTPVLSVEG